MQAFEVTFNYPTKGFQKSIEDGASPQLIQGGTTDKRVFLSETIVGVARAAEEWISGQMASIQNIRDLGLVYNFTQTQEA